MNGLWTEKEMTVEAVIEEDQRCVKKKKEHIFWAVLSDEQMSNGYPFSLLNDEQMSNKVRVEHQPVFQQ